MQQLAPFIKTSNVGPLLLPLLRSQPALSRSNPTSLLLLRCLRHLGRGMATLSSTESQLFGSDRMFVRTSEDSRLQLSLTYPLTQAGESGPQPRLYNFNRPKEEPAIAALARIRASINGQLETRINKLTRKQRVRARGNGNGGAGEASIGDQATQDSLMELEKYMIREIHLQDPSGSPVDASSVLCADAFTSGYSLALNSGSSVYPLLVNPPLVLSCRLTSQLLTGFPMHCELQLESCSRRTYTWELSPSLNKPIWRTFSTDICPTIPVDSGGCFVRLTVESASSPGEDGPGSLRFQQTFGPVTDSISSYYSVRHSFTPAVTPPGSVRVVTYNLLANLYADSDFARDTLFPWCDPGHLAMPYRKCLIMRELAGYNADLVALQEVDEPFFVSGGLKDFMEQCGLEGMRMMKLGKDGQPSPEGLAVFYRSSRFELVAERSVPSLSDQLSNSDDPDLQQLRASVSGNQKFQEFWRERGQCALVLVLRHKDQPSRLLCICTTHLFWFPQGNLIRLLQTHLVMRHLSRVRREFSPTCSSFSLILAGDFNSQPDRGPYALVTKGRVPASHADWYSGALEDRIPRCDLEHDLQLRAAYQPMAFTNFTAGFSGHLDHVFYDPEGLELQDTVPLPSLDEVCELTALPNRCFPSDHLALVAQFMLR